MQCDTPTSLVDVLPTSLGAAGLSAQTDRSGMDLADLATGNAQRDAIVGQLAQEATGVYMLLTNEYKYIYSAADRKNGFSGVCTADLTSGASLVTQGMVEF